MPVIAVQRILDYYAKTDLLLEHTLRNSAHTVSCQKGCAHCCHLLNNINLAEGLVLADRVMQEPDWKNWAQKALKMAKRCCYDGITSENYFNKYYPCVFLDKEKRECRVYAARPLSCRAYYVVSPADDCKSAASVSVLDMNEVHDPLRKYAEEVLGTRVLAPLPIMLLYSLTVLACTDRRYEDRGQFLETLCWEFPITPDMWICTYGESLIRAELPALPLK